MALTARQQRFVDEYLIDLNATQAAIRAGYSAKRADAIGYDLLRKPEIQAEIARLKAARLLLNAMVQAEIERLKEGRTL